MAAKFVAEVSSNHATDLDRALTFVKVAAEIGCDAVKFQLFKIDQLFAPEILKNSANHRNRTKWELPVTFIPDLASYAHELGIEFACTPFYLEAVDILEPYVDFYKIASYELLWLNLFERCADTGKPIVFSTGMANMSEIEAAVSTVLSGISKDITILHCNSTYPTALTDANLQALDSLRQRFNQFQVKPSIGWSDHSRDPAVIYRAVHHYNAAMIEFHLDLEGNGEEYSAGHCWLPDEIAPVIQNIRHGLEADGDGEIRASKSEAGEREWRADPADGLRPLKKTRKNFPPKDFQG